MKREEKISGLQTPEVITDPASKQEKRNVLFPEKLALAEKQLKGVKLPPNKNRK